MPIDRVDMVIRVPTDDSGNQLSGTNIYTARPFNTQIVDDHLGSGSFFQINIDGPGHSGPYTAGGEPRSDFEVAFVDMTTNSDNYEKEITVSLVEFTVYDLDHEAVQYAARGTKYEPPNMPATGTECVTAYNVNQWGRSGVYIDAENAKYLYAGPTCGFSDGDSWNRIHGAWAQTGPMSCRGYQDDCWTCLDDMLTEDAYNPASPNWAFGPSAYTSPLGHSEAGSMALGVGGDLCGDARQLGGRSMSVPLVPVGYGNSHGCDGSTGL